MRVRVVASILLAGLIAAGVVGCASVPQTQRPYYPTDGVSTTVGDVDLLNVVVISEDGQDGNLLATVVNNSDQDVELLLQYDSFTFSPRTNLKIDLPARSTVDLGYGSDGQQVLQEIHVEPGSLLTIYVQYGDKPGRNLNVPVLDDAQAYYQGLLPSPVPTSTPTNAPSPTPTPTPTPTS